MYAQVIVDLSAEALDRVFSYVVPEGMDVVPGQLVAVPLRGGDLAEFIHGGTHISMAGLATNGMPDSVSLDIATGEVTPITNAAGFDMITMTSPNEVYGITMTTRFSTSTDLGALGFVPRPRGDVLVSMMPVMTTYCLDAVLDNSRRGNIGPALISIERSASSAAYNGVSLVDTDDTNWICLGQMSWNATSDRAMWMERRKTGKGVRVRIATI